jgi:hypothetical protein
MIFASHGEAWPPAMLHRGGQKGGARAVKMMI